MSANQNQRLSTDIEEQQEATLRVESENQSRRLATEMEEQQKTMLLKLLEWRVTTKYSHRNGGVKRDQARE